MSNKKHLSLNNSNILRKNHNENEINILNKTKEILRIKKNNVLDVDSKKGEGCLSPPPSAKKKFLKNSRSVAFINNEYFSLKKDDNNLSTNYKVPCSLYVNKTLNNRINESKEKSKNYFSLNNYYNSAINKKENEEKNPKPRYTLYNIERNNQIKKENYYYFNVNLFNNLDDKH